MVHGVSTHSETHEPTSLNVFKQHRYKETLFLFENFAHTYTEEIRDKSLQNQILFVEEGKWVDIFFARWCIETSDKYQFDENSKIFKMMKTKNFISMR